MNIKTVGIVGFGDFGQFLHLLAHKYAPDVTVKVFSSRKEPDGVDFYSLDEVCKTDLLILCVPIAAFAETVAKIKPLIGQGTIVCDVATVKKHTSAVLHESSIKNFICTHPMFGPYSYAKHGDSLADLRVVMCDSSLTVEETGAIVAYLRQVQLTVLEMTSDAHDKLVAETLFLTHLIGQTVHRGRFERTSIDTVSFGFLMDAVESVSHDEALFRDVFAFNPYCKETLARFAQAEAEVLESLGSV